MQLSRPPLPSRSWIKTGTDTCHSPGGYMRLFFMSGHGGRGVREHGGRGGVRTYGVSEGACPLARGHPTGAGAPCWRTALLAKSSVLDLLRPPGRERGCAGQHGHFPVPAEQRKSPGGAAGGYPLFVLRRRGEAASPGRKRATHPPQRRVSIPPRQLQAHIVQRLTLRCPRSALRQVEVPGRLRQRTLCVLVV